MADKKGKESLPFVDIAGYVELMDECLQEAAAPPSLDKFQGSNSTKDSSESSEASPEPKSKRPKKIPKSVMAALGILLALNVLLTGVFQFSGTGRLSKTEADTALREKYNDEYEEIAMVDRFLESVQDVSNLSDDRFVDAVENLNKSSEDLWPKSNFIRGEEFQPDSFALREGELVYDGNTEVIEEYE